MGPRGILFALGLLVAGGVVLAKGGHKTFVAMKNSEPTRMTYTEWAAAESDAEWVELSNVYIDWSASARIDTEHKRKGRTTSVTKEYFVAAWASEKDESPVKCFFVVEDNAKKQFMEQAWTAEERKDENWFAQNANRLYETRTVSGLVRTGFDLDSDDEKILRDMGNVAPKFRIIDMDGKPDGGTGGLMLLGGAVLMALGGGIGFMTLRSSRKAKTPINMPMPGGRPPMPGHPHPHGQHPHPHPHPHDHGHPQVQAPPPPGPRPAMPGNRPPLPGKRPPA